MSISFDRVRETAQAAATLCARVASLKADLDEFAAYNTAQNINYTPATKTFTVANATDVCTATGHGLLDGQKARVTTSGVLPAPLVAGTDYWLRDVTANTFKLAATKGGSAIDLTTDGTGTQTLNPVPDYIEEAAGTGNLSGLLYDRTQVANAIGSLAAIATEIAASGRLSNLNQLASPQV